MLAGRPSGCFKLLGACCGTNDRTNYWVAEDTDGTDERVSVRCDGRVLVPVLRTARRLLCEAATVAASMPRRAGLRQLCFAATIQGEAGS